MQHALPAEVDTELVRQLGQQGLAELEGRHDDLEVLGAEHGRHLGGEEGGVEHLLEDFKPLYRRAGVQGKGAVFLMTDKEVKEESFLEYINIFLNTGELPNLFPRDELDAIIGECRGEYTAMVKGAEPTVDELAAIAGTAARRVLRAAYSDHPAHPTGYPCRVAPAPACRYGPARQGVLQTKDDRYQRPLFQA